MSVVVDTNVPIVANGRAPQADLECQEACLAELGAIRAKETVLLDTAGAILEEYRRHLSPSGQPGVGDSFFKWLWVNQANPGCCRRVPITPDVARRYEEFPADPALAGFDWEDRKFVAVAVASGARPPILNAVDSDWDEFAEALARNGISVKQICEGKR